MPSIRSAAALVAISLFCVPVFGQDAQPARDDAKAPAAAEPAAPKMDAEETPKIQLTFTPRFEHDFSSNLKNSGADSSVYRAGLTFGLSGPIGDRLHWSLDIKEEASWYNWSSVYKLLPSGHGAQPIGDAYEVDINPSLAYSIDRQWTIIGGAFIQFAGEGDADVGKSGTYGGFGGVRYAVSKDLSFTVGLGAKTRLENSAIVIPFLGVNWKVSDKVTVASEGLGARISAKVADNLTLALFARWERREYRLDSDNPIPSGVARDTRVPIGVSIGWQACKAFRLSVDGGVIAYQEFILDDRSGNRIAKDRADPTPFVGVSGQITF